MKETVVPHALCSLNKRNKGKMQTTHDLPNVDY